MSIVDLIVIISSAYYTGNFDNSCSGACGDGHFVRSKYNKDGEFSEFGTPHTAYTFYNEDKSDYYHRYRGG